MIFPIQTVQNKDFTQVIPTDNATFNTANTLALKHCDAMFVVFRKDEHARTCFENPFIEFRFNVDGKFYPQEEMITFDIAKFLNHTMDALNINNSLLTSLSKDLRTSLQQFTTGMKVGEYDGVRTITPYNYWSLDDYSNFLIGIPFCDSEDFMGGTIQIELSGNRKKPADDFSYIKYSATAICFEDALLKIRAIKPECRSQIEITNATLEQILAGGAV